MATLMKMPTDHVPVLAHELVALLDPQPGELAIDCTFGGGGHARAIAERLGPSGTLIAIDRDPVAAERFEALGPELECETRFIHSDFAAALAGLAEDGVVAECVWMDLGISSLQLDDPERGFSYASEAPLDMRMDPSQGASARDAVNDWPEERLAAVIRGYGEERHARAIAREIGRRRPLETTADLVDAIRAAIPPAHRFGRGHPAKRTFQALRIAVNRELELLDAALPLAWDLLAVGGRFAAISFHSLEDRRVKRFLADLARGCICPPELPVCQCGREPEARPLTRKPVAPSPDEAERNPRSRSAHLRAALKVGDRGEPGEVAG
jgi:16S rRNA (cytosine1402-N4)-methyltransferase